MAKQETLQSVEKKAFCLKEIAAMYSVSIPFLRLEIARGRLKPLRLGRCLRIPRDSLEQWTDSEKRPGNRSAA